MSGNSMKGYVYILTNPSMPGIVKIGRSSRSVHFRASELYQTGVPTPFVVDHYLATPDCVDLERRMHTLFAEQRVCSAREFFRTEVSYAKQCLAELLLEQIYEIVDDYLPEYTVVESDFCVDPADVRLVCDNAGVVPKDFIAAFNHLEQSAVIACINRRNERRALRTSHALKSDDGGLLN